MICVYVEFEVDPITTASVVFLKVIPNGFHHLYQILYVFSRKNKVFYIPFRALTDAYPLYFDFTIQLVSSDFLDQ